MPGQFSPDNLTNEEIQRFAHIEGREDLFETKLLEIQSSETSDRHDLEPEDGKHSVLVVSRGPGSGQAVTPVMEHLHSDGIGLMALTDGRAQEIIEQRFSTDDITPQRSVLDAAAPAGAAEVILTDSSTSERGLEMFSSGTLTEKPTILIEDYYTASHGYLRALIERKLPLPEKICVMDTAARDLLLAEFPHLADRIAVTGQPAFDRFTQVDTETTEQRVKEALNIPKDGKLISFISTFIKPEAVAAIAEKISDVSGNIYFAFRKHPRDNTSIEEYNKRFSTLGITCVDTSALSTDDVMAASDLIMTTWSTAGLEGIYLNKPTMHIVDRDILDYPETLPDPIPPVALGASTGIEHIDELPNKLPALLDQTSDAYRDQMKNMHQYYPADGNNAQRVVNIIKQSITTKH